VIDIEGLRTYFEYCEDGHVRWLVDKGSAKKGSVFGCVAKDGYRKGMLFRKGIKHSRLAWALHYGVWPEKCLDHIDGNRLNDRISNLREVSSRQNNTNVNARKTNSTGYLGVSWNKRIGKFQASIKDYCGKQLHLGYFKDVRAATIARKIAELRYYGEYTRSS